MYAVLARLILLADALAVREIRPRRDPVTGTLLPNIPHTCSSPSQGGVFPDRVVINAAGRIVATAEYKVPSVLNSIAQQLMGEVVTFPDIQRYHILNNKVVQGCAVKFLWPEAVIVKKDGVNHVELAPDIPQPDKQSRIIIQVSVLNPEITFLTVCLLEVDTDGGNRRELWHAVLVRSEHLPI